MKKLLVPALAIAAALSVAAPQAAEARNRGNAGAALAAGIVGLAAGALIAGAIAEGNRSRAYAAPVYGGGWGGGPVYHHAPQHHYAPVHGGWGGGYYDEPVVVHRPQRWHQGGWRTGAPPETALEFAQRSNRCRIVHVEQVDPFSGDVLLRRQRVCG